MTQQVLKLFAGYPSVNILLVKALSLKWTNLNLSSLEFKKISRSSLILSIQPYS